MAVRNVIGGKLGKVSIKRNAKLLTYPFASIFSGFEDVGVVREIFGASTKRVLSGLRVALYSSPMWGYMFTDEKRAIIFCNAEYLATAEKRYLYLDVIHELVHIRQLIEGKKLFDMALEYTESPTELEAYKITVGEARRIGMTEKELTDYLHVEWIGKKEFKKFLKALEVGARKAKR